MGSGTPHCQQGCDKEASSSVDIVFLHIHTPYLPCSYHPDHELCTKFNTECIYTSTIKKLICQGSQVACLHIQAIV